MYVYSVLSYYANWQIEKDSAAGRIQSEHLRFEQSKSHSKRRRSTYIFHSDS